MIQNQQIESSAVENTIFNLLVASEKNYEYPSLQPEAVDIISNNITKVVYDTLKQKSIASSTKRCNLLKFLNNVCQTGECHFDKNNYKIYLKTYEQEFCKFDNPEVEKLCDDITKELGSHSRGLKNDIMNFYKKKNVKRQQRIKQLEFIKQNDQEKLSLTLGMHGSRNISHYETSESLLHELLMDSNANNNDEHKCIIKINQDSREYREKQIKFCYALTNFGDKNDMEILNNILKKVSRYKNFERFEIRFIMDLLTYDGQTHLDVNTTIIEHFPFIVEKIVIQFCTEIVKLKDASEISRYFTELEVNPKMSRLRSICVQNLALYYKLRSLIFELYVFSYCNTNVYRFIDLII